MRVCMPKVRPLLPVKKITSQFAGRFSRHGIILRTQLQMIRFLLQNNFLCKHGKKTYSHFPTVNCLNDVPSSCTCCAWHCSCLPSGLSDILLRQQKNTSYVPTYPSPLFANISGQSFALLDDPGISSSYLSWTRNGCNYRRETPKGSFLCVNKLKA